MGHTFNNVKYFEIEGGIQARMSKEERRKLNDLGNLELCKMFPDYVVLKKKMVLGLGSNKNILIKIKKHYLI